MVNDWIITFAEIKEKSLDNIILNDFNQDKKIISMNNKLYEKLTDKYKKSPKLEEFPILLELLDVEQDTKLYCGRFNQMNYHNKEETPIIMNSRVIEDLPSDRKYTAELSIIRDKY